MQMHGFEFSIARMLDGRRTAHDVIQNCERLGIPMDLRSLEGFLHQLQSHALISRAPGRGTPGGARHRSAWSDGARGLYTEALRRARQGDLVGARQRVDELLWLAPGTAEAVRLQHLIDASLATDPQGFQRVFHDVEEAWRSELVDEPPRPSRLARLAIIAALTLTVAAGLSAVPLPRIISAPARLYPGTELKVVAPRAGVVEAVAVREGQEVAKGDELFTWDEGDVRIRLAEKRAALEELRAPMREALAPVASYRPMFAELRQAENKLARAQSALLQGQKEGAVRAPDDVSRRLEADVAAAEARVDGLRATLDAATDTEAPEAAEATQLAYDVQQLQSQLEHRPVRAASAGVVRGLKVEPGQHVSEGEEVLELDDVGRLELVAVLPPAVARGVRVGEPVTVRAGQTKLETAVTAVNDYQLVARFPNPGALEPGPLNVELELPARSFWQQLKR
jgi:multidrug resistance efflux pump